MGVLLAITIKASLELFLGVGLPMEGDIFPALAARIAGVAHLSPFFFRREHTTLRLI